MENIHNFNSDALDEFTHDLIADQISSSKLSDQFQAMFNALDTNGSGKIIFEELKKIITKFSKKRLTLK